MPYFRLDYFSVSKVPQTPENMRGVISFRGSVVPVGDLEPHQTEPP